MLIENKMKEQIKISYASAIREAFIYLLDSYPEVFVMGQGVWSPWYVGQSMTDLDKKYGKSRIIDTPVSEAVVTGAGLGAAISGMKPIIVHPRMDFMLYAIDQIVNQAAKWSHMFGGNINNPSLTIRAMINRGGEQGAQHSQALHSWFAHIPGLRVVMPSSPLDARDLLISSVLSPDPVLYIDDRWLYQEEQMIEHIVEKDLSNEEPVVLKKGNDLTVVSCGFSTKLASEAIDKFCCEDVSIELIDLRILNPIKPEIIFKSISKTKKLLCIDGGWSSCGIASEIISLVCQEMSDVLISKPRKITLPDCPAPSVNILENSYYFNCDDILEVFSNMLP